MNRQERIDRVKLAMLTMQRDSWEQGVAAQAFLELGDTLCMQLFAKEAVLRQKDDGRLAFTYGTSGVTDPASNGEAVIRTGRETGDAKMAAANERMAQYLLHHAPRTAYGVICHVADTRQVWVDAMYMCPPYLAVAGYPEEAVRQLKGCREILFDPEKNMYSHIWDGDTKEFIRKDCWGVGNGWAAAGITRVIAALPVSMEAEKQELTEHLKLLIAGCLTHRTKEGFFHDVVDNPETFVETNLSQMLCYTIYRGVKAGYLDREYLKEADFMREAVYTKVDDYGLVQDVCGAPDFKRPSTATEGQAFFLLMEAAYHDLQ